MHVYNLFLTCLVLSRQSQSDRRRRDLSGTGTYMNSTTTFNRISAKSISKRSENSSLMAMPEKYGIKPDVFPKNERPKDQKTHVEERQPRMKDNYYEYFFQEVNASVLSVTMKNLRHFSSYTISVKACREGTGKNCSNEVIAHQRTGKIGKNNYSSRPTMTIARFISRSLCFPLQTRRTMCRIWLSKSTLARITRWTVSSCRGQRRRIQTASLSVTRFGISASTSSMPNIKTFASHTISIRT